MIGRPNLPAFFSLEAFDSIGSTNEEALARARAGAPEGTVIWARQQTGGRGRRGRSWSSPPGNLYCSLLLRPAVPPAQAAQLGFVAAVGMAEALLAVLPAERRLSCKWPNDLLIDGAKIAGILPEAEAAGRNVEALVLGMGINVESHPTDTPYRATSLQRRRRASDGGSAAREPGRAPAGLVPALAERGFCAGPGALARFRRRAWASPSRCGWKARR